MQPLRVGYFGTYRAEYSRNRIMIEGLRQNQTTVVECHETLWRGIEERVDAVAGGWRRPQFLLRVVSVYSRLIWKFWRSHRQFDVVVVGYPGQFDVYLARILCWLTGKPLVWDIFMSIYLIACERNLDRRHPLTVRLLRALEWLACRLPDRLIIDTAEYANWFWRTHGVRRERFRLVPTGADNRVFQPLPLRAGNQQPLRVVYYGTFIRNHGVMNIVEAAHLLDHGETFEFILVGDGPERAAAAQRAAALAISNLRFVAWLPQAELRQLIADADICLGAFGDTPQSLMTVQNKIYEGLAMQRAVITGDSPAVRAALHNGEEIFLCERQNPVALAQAIQILALDRNLRVRLAVQGAQAFAQRFTLAHIGARFRDALDEFIRAR
ncbi:MAG TPA: glycosyltransferase family 4 protein [Chloroflexi bacterium]|nr:glycosyltransferase family 4 protein [Chloroflexota bacterium]